MKDQLVKDMPRVNCPDCGVVVGKAHVMGCDMERCLICKGQRIGCDCKKNGEREKWSGIGWEEALLYAEEHDLWVYWGPGWVKCDKSHPDAVHDLNTAVAKLMGA